MCQISNFFLIIVFILLVFNYMCYLVVQSNQGLRVTQMLNNVEDDEY